MFNGSGFETSSGTTSHYPSIRQVHLPPFRRPRCNMHFKRKKVFCCMEFKSETLESYFIYFYFQLCSIEEIQRDSKTVDVE